MDRKFDYNPLGFTERERDIIQACCTIILEVCHQPKPAELLVAQHFRDKTSTNVYVYRKGQRNKTQLNFDSNVSNQEKSVQSSFLILAMLIITIYDFPSLRHIYVFKIHGENQPMPLSSTRKDRTHPFVVTLNTEFKPC